eukprot:CAMPEP_0183419278 /NCGR_PEP_ID=MMETSP0370-20130417/25676_1 /TAXON_ID=268820 /ORGANISM="Peridinium aciculiferum, Strain PAER-2" /LENGTH=196 /DNA_ID=CAMNT_0025603065 /DNA_START=185 /DNA_END=777 /DNA_ORIENTATION=+
MPWLRKVKPFSANASALMCPRLANSDKTSLTKCWQFERSCASEKALVVMTESQNSWIERSVAKLCSARGASLKLSLKPVRLHPTPMSAFLSTYKGLPNVRPGRADLQPAAGGEQLEQNASTERPTPTNPSLHLDNALQRNTLSKSGTKECMARSKEEGLGVNASTQTSHAEIWQDAASMQYAHTSQMHGEKVSRVR